MKKAAKKVSKVQKRPAKSANSGGAAGKLTQDEVLKVLKNVIDPEIGMNIVDLGFIYGIDVKGTKVHVRMTLTNPSCPMHSMFVHEVEDALKMVFSDAKVEVEVVFDPPWTPERMSKDARKKLGIK
jgi:metal-sulfur cluster biosynthetic enzyme